MLNQLLKIKILFYIYINSSKYLKFIYNNFLIFQLKIDGNKNISLNSYLFSSDKNFLVPSLLFLF
jgi:hypothetical protein